MIIAIAVLIGAAVVASVVVSEVNLRLNRRDRVTDQPVRVGEPTDTDRPDLPEIQEHPVICGCKECHALWREAMWLIHRQEQLLAEKAELEK